LAGFDRARAAVGVPAPRVRLPAKPVGRSGSAGKRSRMCERRPFRANGAARGPPTTRAPSSSHPREGWSGAAIGGPLLPDCPRAWAAYAGMFPPRTAVRSDDDRGLAWGPRLPRLAVSRPPVCRRCSGTLVARAGWTLTRGPMAGPLFRSPGVMLMEAQGLVEVDAFVLPFSPPTRAENRARAREAEILGSRLPARRRCDRHAVPFRPVLHEEMVDSTRGAPAR